MSAELVIIRVDPASWRVAGRVLQLNNENGMYIKQEELQEMGIDSLLLLNNNIQQELYTRLKKDPSLKDRMTVIIPTDELPEFD